MTQTARRVRSITASDPQRRVKVVGTSHRQPELLALVPHGIETYTRGHGTAVLARDPGNEHDPNAIGVVLAGAHVGYLAREEALAYQPVFDELAARQLGGIRCPATLHGGGEGRGTLGVSLALPAAQWLLAELARASC